MAAPNTSTDPRTEYSDAQYLANYPDGIEHYWWTRARNQVVQRLIRGLPQTAGRVIEIGCGRGVVVDSLRDSGIDCTGVELAPVRPLASVATHVHSGTDALELPDRDRYQTMLLLDVVEHLPDPVASLRSFVAAYPGVRSVIVTVPARPELWSNYDEYFGHFVRYLPDTLRATLQSADLSVDKLGYFFHSLYPVALLQAKASKGQRAVNVNAPTSAPMRAAHRLVAGAMAIDAAIVPASVPGTSLYAVCSVR